MYTQLKAKGFGLVSINLGDKPAVITKFWKQNKFIIPAAANGDKTGEIYKVQVIPANYIVGANGKILARFVGFDEAGIRKALAAAGVK